MERLQSRNPATGEVVGEVAVTPVAQVADAVARARAAQPRWEALPLDARLAALARAGRRLASDREELALLLTREMGKPLRDAQEEVALVVDGFDGLLREIEEALAPEVQQNHRVRTTLHRDAFGVAACITPWNFPVLMPHEQIVPALAAGNAVVFKPSEETPLVGQAYADALRAELPDGVLEVVHGDAPQGRALVAADVDLVAFTGSRDVGKAILETASRRLVRVVLELGGKDPLLVLDGADVARAARYAARNSFHNAGQVCVATERIYVVDAIHDAFVEALVTEAAALKVGDPLDPDTFVGPMVHDRQRQRVRAAVDRAIAQGATVAWQGEAPEGGCFLAPVVLTGCTHAMDITHDETFGPVACVYRAADEEEAVRLANDTRYGLAAVVFGPPDRAHAVARRLKAGMIGVNQGLHAAGPSPWVGARESGYGFHSGRDGHRQFAQIRVVHARIR